MAAQGISRHFGLELEDLSPGQARVGMTCRPDMANILGMVHGTAVFALIDEAFQAACNAHGTVAVALNMNLTFHAAPQMGERLTAQTRELHLGRRTVTYFIEVTDPRGCSGGLLPGPGLPQGPAVALWEGIRTWRQVKKKGVIITPCRSGLFSAKRGNIF